MVNPLSYFLFQSSATGVVYVLSALLNENVRLSLVVLFWFFLVRLVVSNPLSH